MGIMEESKIPLLVGPKPIVLFGPQGQRTQSGH